MPLIESYLPLEASQARPLSELLSILILQAPTEWHRILNGFSNPKFKCHHNRSQNKGSDEVLQYLVICTNSYPSWGFFPCDKHPHQKQLEEERAFCQLKTSRPYSTTDGSWHRDSRQKPGDRNRSRVMEESHLLVCSVCALIQLRNTFPGVTLPPSPVGWDCLHQSSIINYQSIIKKMSHSFSHRPIWGGIFSVEFPSPKGLVYIKLT